MFVVRARELMKPIIHYYTMMRRLKWFSLPLVIDVVLYTQYYIQHKLFYRFPYDLFLDMFVSRCASQKERSPIDKNDCSSMRYKHL